MILISKNLVFIKSIHMVALYLIPTFQTETGTDKMIEVSSTNQNPATSQKSEEPKSAVSANLLGNPNNNNNEDYGQEKRYSLYGEKYDSLRESHNRKDNYSPKNTSIDLLYNPDATLQSNHVHFEIGSDSEDENFTSSTHWDSDPEDNEATKWIPCNGRVHDGVLSLSSYKYHTEAEVWINNKDLAWFNLFKNNQTVRSIITTCLNKMSNDGYSRLCSGCANAVYLIASFDFYSQMWDKIPYIDYSKNKSIVDMMIELAGRKGNFRLGIISAGEFCKGRVLDRALSFLRHYSKDIRVIY